VTKIDVESEGSFRFYIYIHMLTVKENCLTIGSNDDTMTVTIPYEPFSLKGQLKLGKIDTFQKLLNGTLTPEEQVTLEQEQIWMPLSGEKTGYQLYLDVFEAGRAYLEWDPVTKHVSLCQIPFRDRKTEMRPRVKLPTKIHRHLVMWLDILKGQLSVTETF
jgi:hypothetical protein